MGYHGPFLNERLLPVMPISKTAVEIGLKELALGAIYVAFSRIHLLEDIFIKGPFTKYKPDRIRRMEEVTDRLAFKH